MKRLAGYFENIKLRRVPGTSYRAYHLEQIVPETEE